MQWNLHAISLAQLLCRISLTARETDCADWEEFSRAFRFRLQSLNVGDLEIRLSNIPALGQGSKAEKLGNGENIHNRHLGTLTSHL